jgi:hypothetical protein
LTPTSQLFSSNVMYCFAWKIIQVQLFFLHCLLFMSTLLLPQYLLPTIRVSVTPLPRTFPRSSSTAILIVADGEWRRSKGMGFAYIYLYTYAITYFCVNVHPSVWIICTHIYVYVRSELFPQMSSVLYLWWWKQIHESERLLRKAEKIKWLICIIWKGVMMKLTENWKRFGTVLALIFNGFMTWRCNL